MKRAFVAALISCAPSHVPLVLETTQGTIHCEMTPSRGARMVESLAARGHYDGRAFFRVIPGVLVQAGSPTDDGSNGSLERLPVETSKDDAARLAKPGALFLARYTPPPNRVDPNPPIGDAVIGAQIVIGLVDMSHLTNTVTVLGTCRDAGVVTHISNGSEKILRAKIRD